MLSQEELICNAETQKHVDKVRKYLRLIAIELLERGEVHDASKFSDEERPTFAEHTARLKSLTYGSDEYNKCISDMKVALTHHYAKSRHHPEHYSNGIDGMNLIDLVEMFVDWFCSAQRHADGNIIKSIEVNKVRFHMSDQLTSILQNTAELFDGEQS
jgi:hypothetical protein